MKIREQVGRSPIGCVWLRVAAWLGRGAGNGTGSERAVAIASAIAIAIAIALHTPTMATKYGFAKQLKELRFLFCQTSDHSAATRCACPDGENPPFSSAIASHQESRSDADPVPGAFSPNHTRP